MAKPSGFNGRATGLPAVSWVIGTSAAQGDAVIRQLRDGQYRLYSRKRDARTGRRRNLGTFRTRAAAEAHERAVQFFKRRG
jgi:hypothetical protein